MSSEELRGLLQSSGVPVGAPGASLRMPPAETLRKSLALALSTLQAHEKDAVAAWLDGFRHHWPTRFEALVGPAVRAQWEAVGRRDWGRHLKLRRIAIANLTRLLNGA